MKRALVVAFVLALSGCAIVGHEKVDGWPELQVIAHYVPHAEMRDRCGKYVPALMSPEACAEFNLAAGTCDMWFSADFPPSQAVIAHERQHCAGYDHVGATGMADHLRTYRQWSAAEARR